MWPVLRLVVGDVQVAVSTHGLAVVTGVAAGAWLAVRRGGRAMLPAVALTAVVALVGAHALFRLLHGGAGGLRSGGLASTGGVVAGLAAAAALGRLTGRPVAAVLDVLAPAGLLALGIGRLGCFIAGCCYGAPTALPWGVVFPEVGPLPRHPLQLYSAAGDLALVACLPAAEAPTGTAARRACLGFGLLRAALELLRDAGTTDVLPGGHVTLPQAVALCLVAGSLAVGRSRLRRQGASTMPAPRRKTANGR